MEHPQFLFTVPGILPKAGAAMDTPAPMHIIEKGLRLHFFQDGAESNSELFRDEWLGAGDV